jgi:nicotinate-nucleotide--dimethylbenzimidazole phosphoribosyltransferase
MTCLTNIPLLQCVGAGAGLDGDGVRHKYQTLKRALDNYRGDRSATDVMRCFGGCEMAMATGAMLQAAELKMMILVDGFIMTNCLLAASLLHPEIMPYAVFGHCSGEAGHGLLLQAMNARPLLNLGMRLGEGTGAICAYPLLDSAVRMINEMNSFDTGAITKYF